MLFYSLFQFEGLAFEINDAAKERVKSVFQIMNGVTTMMTSFIDIQNSTNYPKGFITIPHLEQHLGTARNASDALVLAYVPLVQASDLQLWNEYSKKNKGWVADHYTVGHNNTEVVTPILTTIWDYAAQDNNSYSYENDCIDGYMHEEDRVPVTTKRGPFAPLWTFSPGPKPSDSSIINHDLFSRKEFEQAIQSVNSTRQPMFLDVCNMARWFNVEIQRDYVEALIAFPVLDGFSDTSEIVGYMILIMPWSTFFQVSLPEATKSCHVVLKSSCGQVATYEIRDQNVVLLGRKDVHNREFHSQGVLAVFADFANTSDMVDSGLDRVCEYTTTVYPTTEFHETFQNQKPIWYALIVLGIYMLTSVLFCLFDVLMTRQRNRVMEAAEKQHAIVSSLFPKNIQAKLMQQADTDNTRLSKIGKAGLKNYLFDSITDGDQGNMEVVSQEANTGGHRRLDKSKPIADLFPETTIMFGDIAG